MNEIDNRSEVLNELRPVKRVLVKNDIKAGGWCRRIYLFTRPISYKHRFVCVCLDDEAAYIRGGSFSDDGSFSDKAWLFMKEHYDPPHWSFGQYRPLMTLREKATNTLVVVTVCDYSKRCIVLSGIGEIYLLDVLAETFDLFNADGTVTPLYNNIDQLKGYEDV